MQKTTYKQSKIDTINAVEKLLKTHKTIAFCSLFKVRGAQLMSLRKSFKDEMRIRVVRNTLTKLAIEKSQIKKLITTDTIDNSKKIGKSKKIEHLKCF